nr:immunoglobulin heavy chain junction region [Mus musculus]
TVQEVVTTAGLLT